MFLACVLNLWLIYLLFCERLNMAAAASTPINTVTRDNLVALIRNNVLNNSLEFTPDPDVMQTDSPVRKPTSLQPVIKKLFHSPVSPGSAERTSFPRREEKSRLRKRKIRLIPDTDDHIKMAYVKERDEYSPDVYGGMRKRILISLFHNKEYSMDIGD